MQTLGSKIKIAEASYCDSCSSAPVVHNENFVAVEGSCLGDAVRKKLFENWWQFRPEVGHCVVKKWKLVYEDPSSVHAVWLTSSNAWNWQEITDFILRFFLQILVEDENLLHHYKMKIFFKPMEKMFHILNLTKKRLHANRWLEWWQFALLAISVLRETSKVVICLIWAQITLEHIL